MKSLFVPLAGLSALATVIGTAAAAPPEYCALYAREYANQFSAAAGEKPGSEQKIQDEAYYRCLNMDEEPEMPPNSAYSGTSVDNTGQGGPLEPAPDAAAPADTAAAPAGEEAAPVADTPPAAPAKPAAPAQKKTAGSSPVKHSYTSGEEPGTAAWAKWCRDHFPNSFDEKTGTIMPFGATKRQPCK